MTTIKTLAVLALFAALLAVVWAWRTPDEYSTAAAQDRMAALRQRAADAGYHVREADTPLFFEFFVSREPFDGPVLSKADADLWDGIIWITHNSEAVGIVGRNWRGVVGVGDPALLDEFEETCRPGR